jgi:hypothetical protein
MLDFFETRTQVHFQPGLATPDFYGETDCAGTGGRSLVAQPYDGRHMGPLLAKLAPPLVETTLMAWPLPRVRICAPSSPLSDHGVPAPCADTIGTPWMDMLRHGRSMQLVNGHALAARLLHSAAERNVPLLTQTRVEALDIRHGRVTGARTHPGGPGIIRATRRVLACGGFPHDPERQAMLLPHVANGFAHHSAAPTATRATACAWPKGWGSCRYAPGRSRRMGPGFAGPKGQG